MTRLGHAVGPRSFAKNCYRRMNMRKRVSWKIGTLIAVLLLGVTWRAGSAQDSTAAAESDGPLAKELAAIEKRIASYLEAYNKKDLQAVVEHWTEQGVYIDASSGSRIKGREALAESMKEAFESKDSGKLECELQSLDLISPGVALEKGISYYTVGENESVITTYSAVHMKIGDQWYIDRISEKEYVEPPSNYEYLKPLEWMIGNWTDRNGDASISTECHWARNENFIIRSFTVGLSDQIKMAGMQIIGWDPVREKVRSWTFDSDGGFNEGVWTESNGIWSVQSTATLPNGTLGSSTTVLTPVDKSTFTWQQINRIVDGELLPNLNEVVITRAVEE